MHVWEWHTWMFALVFEGSVGVEGWGGLLSGGFVRWGMRADEGRVEGASFFFLGLGGRVVRCRAEESLTLGCFNEER